MKNHSWLHSHVAYIKNFSQSLQIDPRWRLSGLGRLRWTWLRHQVAQWEFLPTVSADSQLSTSWSWFVVPVCVLDSFPCQRSDPLPDAAQDSQLASHHKHFVSLELYKDSGGTQYIPPAFSHCLTPLSPRFTFPFPLSLWFKTQIPFLVLSQAIL